MRFVLERVSGPSVEPVTLAEMITHLREFASISEGAQDEITALITTAREWVEDYTGRALVEQSWRLSVDKRIGNGPRRVILPPGNVENGYGWYSWDSPDCIDGWLLHKSPVVAITSFASVDDAGTETEIDADQYLLKAADSKWPKIASTTGSIWAGNQFRITYRAGFAASVGSPDPSPDVSLVPRRYVQAIKLYAEALYDRDKDMMPALMKAAEAVIASERADISLA
jgi:hypothetical protein